MPDLAGQIIGRYQILAPLGEGGMATVYKALDTHLDCEVAVKVIRVDQLAPAVLEKALKRFEREAKEVAKLNHPNIVRVMDYGEHEGIPYLVMPYLHGGTLKQKMGSPIPYQKAVLLLEPIARALEYAHQRKMIHRDVKPANILIADSGDVMLSDFGIAKILDLEGGQTLTGTGMGIGTPAYIAPEQALGDDIDGRADIYSLGIVFFEMVTGRVPYFSATPITPMKMVNKHINEPLPIPSTLLPELPKELDYFLFKALAKTPVDRYANMAEFIAALTALSKLPESGTSALTDTIPFKKEESKEQVMDADPDATKDLIELDIPKPPDIPTEEIDQTGTAQKSSKKTAGWEEKPIIKKKLKPWRLLAAGASIIGLVTLVFWLSDTPPPAVETPTSTPTPIRLDVTQTMTTTVTPISPSPAPALGIGSTQVSDKDGMVMVYVPAGEFTMGSNDGPSDEQPVHQVFLDTYWIDQTEVTNAMYKKCVDSGPCAAPALLSHYDNSQYADHPVVYVNWNQAKAYCEWADRQLPTEAQWEKAARGTDERIYPWGNETPTCSLANYADCNKHSSSKVGSYEAGKSPYDANDMAGNVSEWVADWYSTYPSGTLNNPTGANTGQDRVFRGGSWGLSSDYIHSANRSWNVPFLTYFDLGFRCAKTEKGNPVIIPTLEESNPLPSPTVKPTEYKVTVTVINQDCRIGYLYLDGAKIKNMYPGQVNQISLWALTRYKIEWCFGQTCQQSASNIFLSDTTIVVPKESAWCN